MMFLIEQSLAKQILCNCLRRYSRTVKYKKDPGIKRRGKIMDPQELDNMDLELDDLETDFMNVNQSHKEHLREMEARHEKLKYLIVKQKYFKEKFPNFLTWQEKEQIRYLHNKDPEEWSIEQLSESFPALPDTIKKVLKSDFTKPESKISNHDASVEQNWKNFKTGKMPDLPADLVDHLKKFTSRASINKPSASLSSPHTKKEIVSQSSSPTNFSEIITSYQRLKTKNQELGESEKAPINTKLPSLPSTSEGHDTFLTIDKKSMTDRKSVTLSKLQGSIEDKASKGDRLSEEEKLMLHQLKPADKAGGAPIRAAEDSRTAAVNKFSSTGRSLVKKSERDFAHLVYPERIKIPKGSRRKGFTYRLNDCYYDCDGEFLYRVPGMGG